MESAYMFDIINIYINYLEVNTLKNNKRDRIEYLSETSKKQKINIDLKNKYKSILKRELDKIEDFNNFKYRKK